MTLQSPFEAKEVVVRRRWSKMLVRDFALGRWKNESLSRESLYSEKSYFYFILVSWLSIWGDFGDSAPNTIWESRYFCELTCVLFLLFFLSIWYEADLRFLVTCLVFFLEPGKVVLGTLSSLVWMFLRLSRLSLKAAEC